MPTKNPRINITFEEVAVGILSKMAKQQKKSLSSLAKELILEALERREDMALSDIARARDIDNAKRIAHHDVWK